MQSGARKTIELADCFASVGIVVDNNRMDISSPGENVCQRRPYRESQGSCEPFHVPITPLDTSHRPMCELFRRHSATLPRAELVRLVTLMNRLVHWSRVWRKHQAATKLVHFMRRGCRLEVLLASAVRARVARTHDFMRSRQGVEEVLARRRLNSQAQASDLWKALTASTGTSLGS